MSQAEPKLKIVHADRINLTWRDGQYRVDVSGDDVVGEYVRADKYDALEALLTPLMEIAERMHGQDNRATVHPTFIVQQKRRIYGLDLDYTDKKAWIYDGDEVATTRKGEKRFLRENDMTEAQAWESGFLQETGYVDIHEFVQVFFSCEEANAYIKANRHNLTDPRVYVDSAYRNYEWQAIRSVLLKIGGGE